MATTEMRATIHSHPEIMSGVPVFVGTRVPVRNLIDYLVAGTGSRPSSTISRASVATRRWPPSRSPSTCSSPSPMRVLLDESMPRQFGRAIVGHEVWGG
jgi:hypothetical protein